MATALQTLLPGISPEKFLDEHWCKKPLADHGPLDRLPQLAGAEPLRSIQALLASAREGSGVRVWSRTPAGEVVMTNVEPSQARDLYRSGQVTVVMDYVHASQPVISNFMSKLAFDLGTPMR